MRPIRWLLTFLGLFVLLPDKVRALTFCLLLAGMVLASMLIVWVGLLIVNLTFRFKK